VESRSAPTTSTKNKKKKPRTRHRLGTQASTKIVEDSKAPFISTKGTVEHKIPVLNGNLPRQRAFCVRNSDRWCRTQKVNTYPDTFDVPYLDQLGRPTGNTLLRWTCQAPAFVASMVSTTARRLLLYARRHNSWQVLNKNLYRIVMASYLYVSTKNSYFWDRILFFSRNLEKNGPLIHRFMLRCLVRTNDSIRFVYGQVALQTNWLLFRAERPRDKFARWCTGNLGNKIYCAPVKVAGHITNLARAIEVM
jgi:hypothetical protein